MKLKKDKRINTGFFSVKQFLILFFIIMLISASYNSIYMLYDHQPDDYKILPNALLGNLLFFTVITTVLLGYAKRYLFGKPIRKIAEAARRVTSGDFTVRIDPFRKDGKKDEIEVLVEDFNTMIEELGTIETLKTDFIANVSHELKSPLSVIQSYATAIQDDTLSPEERDEYSKTIVETTKRLSELVTNILKLSKLDNQEIIPISEPYALNEQLYDCIIENEEWGEKKGITFIGEDINEVTVNYDKTLLEPVWHNLITNAIKFTDSGGEVTLTLKEESGYAVVTVNDTGCGMNEETKEHIFDKFYQGDTSHSTEGNGLGLPLVKKVIDILGGQISVASRINEGTTFTIKLKL